MVMCRNSSRFLIGIEKSLSLKGIIKIEENIQIFLYNIHSVRNNTDTNELIDEMRD